MPITVKGCLYEIPFERVTIIIFRAISVHTKLVSDTLKGLCHPRRMRALIRSTLKSLAQLFQIPSESLRSCFNLFEWRSSSESWLNFLFTNVF